MNRVENLKRDSINSFSNYEWFPEWENFLVLNYWKDWRNKIPAFQTEEELDFYTQRLDEIAYAIWKRKKYGERKAKGLFHYHFSHEKHGVMEGIDPDEMIKQEELRLQNISQGDWQKEYRFANAHLDFKEMSAEEINQNFGKDIEAIIKGEISERLNKSVNYNGWTKEQLSKEVEKLTFLTNELKKTENLDNSQIVNRDLIAQKLERQLNVSKLTLNSLNNNNNNNNNPSLPIIPIISTIGLIALCGLVVYKFSRKKIRR